jgi:type II secretory pathway pseudopilin PulG
MTHQVNLNAKQIIPGFGPMQLPVFVWVVFAALAASGVWIYLSWNERQTLLAEEASLMASLAEAQKELTQFQQQYPNINNEPDLLTENQRLTEELAKARETFSGLANQVENAIEGFYQPLVQLSDYDLDGLWLDTIMLKDGTGFFALEGYSRNPELIPTYIEQLGNSEFKGITIKSLSLAKESNQALWRFTLSNNPALAQQEEAR